MTKDNLYQFVNDFINAQSSRSAGYALSPDSKTTFIGTVIISFPVYKYIQFMFQSSLRLIYVYYNLFHKQTSEVSSAR